MKNKTALTLIAPDVASRRPIQCCPQELEAFSREMENFQTFAPQIPDKFRLHMKRTKSSTQDHSCNSCLKNLVARKFFGNFASDFRD